MFILLQLGKHVTIYKYIKRVIKFIGGEPNLQTGYIRGTSSPTRRQNFLCTDVTNSSWIWKKPCSRAQYSLFLDPDTL